MKKLKKYINKEMTEMELDAFSRNLLQSKFDKDQKEEWAAKLKGAPQVERASVTQTPKKQSRFWLLTAAAVIGLLLLAIPVFNSLNAPTSQELASELILESRISNPIVRKGEPDQSQLRLQFAEAYNKKAYDQAVQLGNQLIQTANPKMEDLLFVGLSHLYQQQYDDAINVLAIAKTNNKQQQRFQEEICWFLSLAYVKAQQPNLAEQELSAIVQSNGWNAASAERLLELLEKR